MSAGSCPVLQPNYGAIAAAASIHRGICQRLILELTQRLSAHLLAGRAMNVSMQGALAAGRVAAHGSLRRITL
jgi:hypothetical protein